MRCKICQTEFTPNKYHPNQQICSSPECQRRRQILNVKTWRDKNPEYFKCRGQEELWRENRHRYSQLWRMVHKGHLKKYQKTHRQQRREYMREYMRRKRAIRIQKQASVNRNKS